MFVNSKQIQSDARKERSLRVEPIEAVEWSLQFSFRPELFVPEISSSAALNMVAFVR
jgi:hypothetical protein